MTLLSFTSTRLMTFQAGDPGNVSPTIAPRALCPVFRSDGTQPMTFETVAAAFCQYIKSCNSSAQAKPDANFSIWIPPQIQRTLRRPRRIGHALDDQESNRYLTTADNEAISGFGRKWSSVRTLEYFCAGEEVSGVLHARSTSIKASSLFLHADLVE